MCRNAAIVTANQHSLGMRIRAARLLAGYTTPKALADHFKAQGVNKLGSTKLYMAERDEQPLEYRDLEEIAYACGLPVAFFTADFSRLPEISEDPRKVIARETAAAVQRSVERRAAQTEGSRSRRRANPEC
jgi:transcriptional regulator with XRE-family HTH domain